MENSLPIALSTGGWDPCHGHTNDVLVEADYVRVISKLDKNE
jgi:hypothetical protein